MIDVRELDRTDEAQLRAYWELGKACMRELAHDFWPAWESARRVWATPNPERDIVFYGAFDGGVDGGQMIGGAWLGVPLVDNLHLAHFELYVAAAARRRGAGSLLLDAVETVAAERGRTTLLTDTVVPVDGAGAGAGAGSGGGAGLGFGAALGYARVSTEECKVVDLAEHEVELVDLAARAAERAAGYELVVWEDPLPETWMADMCELYSSFMGEIPLEDLDLHDQVFTPERVRAVEERRVASGNRGLTVAVVAPDGHLAGFTEVGVFDDLPERGDIHSTLVVPAHRGHRLGLALKTRLHQEVRSRFPAVTSVATYNAGVNDHMNAVNAALGYRVQQHVVGLQRKT